jgi:ribosomal protein S27E
MKRYRTVTPCECGDEHIWYDHRTGAYRCRNCGWSCE